MSVYGFFFFFKQKTAYEMRISDWSSDVCSSDLLAVAAPIPRLAPVTSATRPERGWSFIALLGLIQAFCEQCELIDLDSVVLIGERSRIVAGEAGVAMRGPDVGAVRFAERLVEPVDRDEGEDVGLDVVGHLIEIHLGDRKSTRKSTRLNSSH